MLMVTRILMLCIGLFVQYFTFANDVTVSNVSLINQNVTDNFTMVRFDIAWSNSWRTSTFESNWDASWIFVKYRRAAETVWYHATIHTTGQTTPAGASIAIPADGTGAFIYRSSDGVGDVAWTGVELRWNYGVDGLEDYDNVEIAVLAIEMVLVPQGSFYLGDNSPTIVGQFEQGISSQSFQVVSEAALTLGGGGAGSLGNNNATGMEVADDFNDVTTQTLPAAFPKGYAGFYCMKYEMSQRQYVEFLNRLTRPQQTTHASAIITGRYMSNESGWSASPQVRNGIRLLADPGSPQPRVYGNDLNGNGVANELSDGENIPCNWISITSYMAYLDWAGLRPMTELEYEKSCRGILTPIIAEYAWGNTNITGTTGISNATLANEVASNASANCAYAGGVQGPLRSGAFAQASSSRQSSGGTYYGIMEMSGNLWEYCIKVGNAQGRNFTGTHGDGELTVAGYKTNADWGNDTGTNHAIGLRGSDWLGVALNWLTISGRYFSGWANDAATSYSTTTVRGVRSAF
ncbi:MAG: hypothetical protein EBR30_11625 [Cytophagia bacterium]|nr:hypothetical protein [Cytophagia bacterium]NBW35641.1 hypothetical protein [Cytophagia bacterium]